MSELSAQNALAEMLRGWGERIEEAQLHVDKSLTSAELETLATDLSVMSHLVSSMLGRLQREAAAQ